MRSKTFPKENLKKSNETIRDLKALLRQKDKEIKFLRDEIDNITKPVRERRKHEDPVRLEGEAWKKDFIKRFKRDVLGDKE